MLKKLQLACVLLFIIGCNKYEYVDNTTRFNKSSGNIEKLQNDGSWIKDAYNQVPSNKWKDIKIEFLQFNAGWGCIVTNNSNYTIQNIFLQLQIKDQHMKDELTTQELTCNADYYLKPHSIRNYISCSPQPPQLLENQTWDYNIQKIHGFIDEEVNI